MIQYTRDGWKKLVDQVAAEYPLTIKINGQEFATLVCTPEYIEDLVVGFLMSEGVISQFDDIEGMVLQKHVGIIQVTSKKVNPYYQEFHSKRYIASCCGKGRQGFYFLNDARMAKDLKQAKNTTLTVEQCFSLMDQLHATSTTFQCTGGVHNASLCDKQGIIVSRMDIGRHNALDKIYGHCLRNQISLSGKVMVFSGRISSEILLKVAKIGCEMVLSKSAPTELALELAQDLGITTVGFIRKDSLNIYTHPERIENLVDD
ncbi:formate dehydrogenase accessory sulfurtransferase FdhD [Ammoniphilus sp. CFH 90114]|uniref:formate dehydrogenase accessory sulfurtransferase FdhD n=1 Tax=Ammoniphilus sp. CFH 90114 TaxID=2493665 RepID=UPI001F0B7EDB|nr:formate dehydrogenase accessory sulfurtransferase FdhD [Ammoniphilus sp. CFH 90114]